MATEPIDAPPLSILASINPTFHLVGLINDNIGAFPGMPIAKAATVSSGHRTPIITPVIPTPATEPIYRNHDRRRLERMRQHVGDDGDADRAAGTARSVDNGVVRSEGGRIFCDINGLSGLFKA
jgi:hypothetical protein